MRIQHPANLAARPWFAQLCAVSSHRGGFDHRYRLDELQALAIGGDVHRAGRPHAHRRPDPDRVIEAASGVVYCNGARRHNPILHSAAPVSRGLAHRLAVHGDAIAQWCFPMQLKSASAVVMGSGPAQAPLQVPLHIAGPALGGVILQFPTSLRRSVRPLRMVRATGSRKGPAPIISAFPSARWSWRRRVAGRLARQGGSNSSRSTSQSTPVSPASTGPRHRWRREVAMAMNWMR